MIWIILNLLLLSNCVLAHSLLFTDVGTIRKEDIVIYRGPNSSTCGIPKEHAHPEKIVLKRGQLINVNWPRNNHNGGFVKWAIVPFEQSDNQTAFDQNVFHYECFQASKCVSGYPTFSFGGDGPNFKPNENKCYSKLKVPDWLPKGQYTIQWKWYGGSGYTSVEGNDFLMVGVGTFFSCLDVTIEGGVMRRKPDHPTFKGGDVHTKDNKTCIYYDAKTNDTRIPDEYRCYPDICEGKNMTAIPSEIQALAQTHHLQNDDNSPKLPHHVHSNCYGRRCNFNKIRN